MKRIAKVHFGKLFLFFFIIFTTIFCLFYAANMLLPASEQAANAKATKKIYDLKVYYIDEGTTSEIYPHYHAKLPEGEAYSVRIYEISGYELIDDEGKYEENEAGEKSVSGILTEDTVITVEYIHEQKTAKYTVNYYKMDIEGDSVKLTLDESIQRIAKINERVTVELKTIEGYSWSISDLLLTVTSDGKAVKNLYYIKTDDRLVIIRTGTGFVKTVSASPGANITDELNEILMDAPTREGFTFDGWKNTMDSTIVDAENGVENFVMPETDVVFTARWVAGGIATYAVEFYFENKNLDRTSYDKYNLSNYTKQSKLDEWREGEIGTELKPTDKDIKLPDREYLFYDEESKTFKTTSNDKSIWSGTSSTYIANCPFFGFNYAFCKTNNDDNVIQYDGSSVLKLYFTREERVMNIWGHALKSGTKKTVDNTKWLTINGYFEDSLPDTFPDYFAMDAHFCSGKTAVFIDQEQSYQQTVILESDDTFTITLEGETITGTYTYSSGKYSFRKADSTTTYTATLSGTTLKLSKDGKATTFYKAAFSGLIEQNSAGSVSTGTISPSTFRTSKDIISGELNFYPFFIKDADMKNFSRVIYAMPDDFDEWSAEEQANIDLTQLLTVFKKKISKTKNGNTPGITPSAFVGYQIAGYYRVSDTEDGLEGAEWHAITENSSARCWYDKPTTGERIAFNIVGDSHYQILLKPMVSNLYFYDGENRLEEVYYDENGDGECDESEKVDASMFKEVKYNSVLSFISKILLKSNTDEYEFGGWCYDTEHINPVNPTDVCVEQSNWDIYVKWVSKVIKIEYDAMGGILEKDGSKIDSENITMGYSGIPPKPTKVNFEFRGWYTSSGNRFEDYSFLNTLHNVKKLAVHAVWEPAQVVEYKVYHYLKETVDGTETETLLDQYTETRFAILGQTVNVSALTDNYISGDGESDAAYLILAENQATKSIEIKEDSGLNTAAFYYKRQETWAYKVYYCFRDSTTEIAPVKTETNTDLMFVAEEAIEIDGYAMIMTDAEGNAIDGEYGLGYVEKALSAIGQNAVYIYYDYVYDIVFCNKEGGTHTVIPMLYKEVITMPHNPDCPDFIFLGWNEEEDGSGVTYYPDDNYTLTYRPYNAPEDETPVYIYPEWAHAARKATQGRILNCISEGSNNALAIKEDGIAQNGALTVFIALEDMPSKNILRNAIGRLRLRSANVFPVGTTMTMIVYPNKGDALGAKFYYYKASSDTQYVNIVEFTEMGGLNKFVPSNANYFRCQICVVFPDDFVQSESSFCMSVSAYREDATEIELTFRDKIKLPVKEEAGPAMIAAIENIEEAGKLSTDVTVSNLDASALLADSSDRRNVSGTPTARRAVLFITMRDSNDVIVPFPENCIVKIAGVTVKEAGAVAGRVAAIVDNGTYSVEAENLQTEKAVRIYFTLCIADSEGKEDIEHSMNIRSDSTSLLLPYKEVVHYSIRASIEKGERVFAVPTTETTLEFNVLYAPAGEFDDLSITVYSKGEHGYVPNVAWSVQKEEKTGGAAAVKVTVPEGAAAGTYRIEFKIGSAVYYCNIILTAD